MNEQLLEQIYEDLDECNHRTAREQRDCEVCFGGISLGIHAAGDEFHDRHHDWFMLTCAPEHSEAAILRVADIIRQRHGTNK